MISETLTNAQLAELDKHVAAVLAAGHGSVTIRITKGQIRFFDRLISCSAPADPGGPVMSPSRPIAPRRRSGFTGGSNDH
jgi:hypothetical protein